MVAPVAPFPPHNWNQVRGLVPPSGTMWRGATLDLQLYRGNFSGPIRAFEADYEVPLHIYRGFFTPHYTKFSDEEVAFAKGGGIIFYSIQPNNWTEWSHYWPKSTWWQKNYGNVLDSYAAAVKSVEPHQVMVAPGFEPDGHAAESQSNTKLVYGKAAEYKAMFLNFRQAFRRNNVTNAIFVMDLSCDIRSHEFVLDSLWPGNNAVDWLFFNLFSSHKYTDEKGNCSNMLHSIYSQTETLSNATHNYTSVPWGLGAWGPMNETFGDPAHGYPAKAIPLDDRRTCITDVQAILEERLHEFPRFAAANYFNSLKCIVSPRPIGGSNTPELVPTLRKYFTAPPFVANDKNASVPDM